MKKYLPLAALFAVGLIVGACGTNGASALDLTDLGRIGDLVQELRDGTQENVQRTRKAVQAALVTYCGTVPLTLRETLRDLVNDNPDGPQIGISCPGDPGRKPSAT